MEKRSSVWIAWDNSDGKLITTGATKHEVCEYLSYGGYLSQVVDDHPGFEILEYTLDADSFRAKVREMREAQEAWMVGGQNRLQVDKLEAEVDALVGLD